MRRLHTSIVGNDETDDLGHMNVRFYMLRVEEANAALMAELGLEAGALAARGHALARVDSYCKYNREQFPGATLQVQGGVLDAADDGLTMYWEVRNPAQAVHAASFIVEFALQDLATRGRLSLPDQALHAAQSGRVPLPAYGAPRSLSLDPPRLDVSLADITARVGDGSRSMMGGLMERQVEAEFCDAHGFLRPGEDLVMGPKQRAAMLETRKHLGPQVQLSAAGRRFGWAWMETRAMVFETPRAGDILRSIGADVALGKKTRQSRRWIFNQTSGRMAGADDMVGICLDLEARKSIEIPPEVRAELAQVYVPEFA